MSTTIDPQAACRACRRTAGAHPFEQLDHPLVPLLTGQRPPGWMTLEERGAFTRLSAQWDRGTPVAWSEALEKAAEPFRLAWQMSPAEALEKAAASSWSIPSFPLADAHAELVERMARKIDAKVIDHLEGASEADLWRIITEAGSDWIDRTRTLARQVRTARAELAEVRRQRDRADALADERGDQLDRLEGGLRALLGGIDVRPTTTYEVDGGVKADPEDEPDARMAVQCDARLSPAGDTTGQMLPLRCEFYAGHDEPHRAGGWTWR